jgi:hypothetical protein
MEPTNVSLQFLFCERKHYIGIKVTFFFRCKNQTLLLLSKWKVLLEEVSEKKAICLNEYLTWSQKFMLISDNSIGQNKNWYLTAYWTCVIEIKWLFWSERVTGYTMLRQMKTMDWQRAWIQRMQAQYICWGSGLIYYRKAVRNSQWKEYHMQKN